MELLTDSGDSPLDGYPQTVEFNIGCSDENEDDAVFEPVSDHVSPSTQFSKATLLVRKEEEWPLSNDYRRHAASPLLACASDPMKDVLHKVNTKMNNQYLYFF